MKTGWRVFAGCSAGLLLFLAAGAGFLYFLVQSVDVAKRTSCLSGVKQLAHAALAYRSDHDERFPLRDSWRDASRRYSAQSVDVKCPTAPTGAFGIAFNAVLSGARPPKSPSLVPLVYDSANPIRNASDPFTSLPSPARHRGKNNVAYADGHAKGVPSP